MKHKKQATNQAAMKIRLTFEQEDIGLEPVFFYLRSLSTPIARSHAVRSLLLHPASVNSQAIEAIRTANTPGIWINERVTVIVSISSRDTGLAEILSEINTYPSKTQQRACIKRRLILLLAHKGIGVIGDLMRGQPALIAANEPRTSIPVAPSQAHHQLASPVPLALPAKTSAHDAPLNHPSPLAQRTQAESTEPVVLDLSSIKQEDQENKVEPIINQGNLKATRFKNASNFFKNH